MVSSIAPGNNMGAYYISGGSIFVKIENIWNQGAISLEDKMGDPLEPYRAQSDETLHLEICYREPGPGGGIGKHFIVSLAGKNVFRSSIDNLIIYS
jgi:hypothetical protein